MGLPLITRAEYKAYAGLTSTNSDALIDALIPKVSQLVKTICRRTFIDWVNDQKTEYHDGGTNILVPQESPVLSIAGLEYSEDYGQTYTALTEFVDYVHSRTSDCVMSVSTKGFAYKPNAYRLTYTAGYETLPEDLKLAVMDLLTYYIKNDAAIHSSKAPGTNSVQIEYVTTTNLPAHIKRVLDQYADNYN